MIVIGAGVERDLDYISFFPSKNLGAFEDGGIITDRDPDLAEKLRMLRLHGYNAMYFHRIVGINSKFDALQAAILGVKLKHLDTWSTARQEKATYYNKVVYRSGLGF